jgi:hypothetical protein
MSQEESKNDLATKMSLQKIVNEYPLMDPTAIEDIFETNGRDYNATVKALNQVYETESKVKNVYTEDALKLKEEADFEQAMRESIKVY